MLHSHSSQLWLDPLLVPLSFEPFLISALKKFRSLFHDLTKMALKFKKFPQKSNWMNNVHMTTEKMQISAAQTRICWDHREEGEDIKTRATISWIIEPLSKLRIYSNGSWTSVSQHTGMFWLMIEKKNSHDNKNLLVWDYHEFQLWRLTNDLFGRRTSCVLVVAVMLWEELGKLVLLSCCMSSKLWSHNYTWPLVKKP